MMGECKNDQQTIYNKFDESVPRLKSQLKARSAQFKTMKKENKQ